MWGKILSTHILKYKMEKESIITSKVRSEMIHKLKDRNAREKRLLGIVRLCNSLHESADFLRNENCRLQALNMRRTSECRQPKDNETEINLKKKIYELQEELTKVHRTEGKYADQIIELQKAIDEKEKSMALKNGQIVELQNYLAISKAKREELEEKCGDTDRALQLLKDEYDTLSITYASLQKSMAKLETEHVDLVKRWNEYQIKVAEELNKENELFQKLKQVKIRKEMEEAVYEPDPGPSSSRSYSVN